MELITEDLAVDYGGGPVVRSVSVSVRQGEFVALVGPNGAGKTSLLKGIMGFAPVSRGSVRLGSSKLDRLSPDARSRHGIVFVPEDRGLFPNMSVLDHLWLGCHRRPSGPQLDEVLKLFPPLAARLRLKAGALSGGEAQMLAIATALLLRPKLLLIDELSLGLGPIVVGELLKRCESLAHHDGIGVLVVEQFVDMVLAIADRALVMSHGEIRISGSASEVLSDPSVLRQAYLG